MIYPPLKVKKLFPDAQLPVRANQTDSGLDVFVHHFEDFNPHADKFLLLNDRILVATGLSIAIEPGYEVQVRPRSGNALKKGLTVLNSPGTIDSSFRGAVNVIIINLSAEQQKICVGDKIAQLVIAPVCLSEVVEVENLDETDRGQSGFGSTGA
jgi:dUTP pyrophosphatase